ncbi:MAG: hypothetical protein WBF67_10815 [Olleya sp.]
MKVINNGLIYLSFILLFVNAVLYSYSYFKNNKSKAVKYLAIYLTLSFCFSIASKLTIYIQEQFNIVKNNLFLTHYYFILQFIFLSLFYSILFTKKQKNYQIIISVLVFLILLIQYGTNTGLYYKFNLLEILITSLPLVIYSVFHLYNSLSKPGNYMFINAGVLVYLSVSTLVFILGNLMNTLDRSLSGDIWFLNRLFYLVYLVLFLIEWKKNVWKTIN